MAKKFMRATNKTLTLTEPLKIKRIKEIAREIWALWAQKGKGVNYAAKPYLLALTELDAQGNYLVEHYSGLVPRALGAMSSFRGDDARRLKAELKGLVQ